MVRKADFPAATGRLTWRYPRSAGGVEGDPMKFRHRLAAVVAFVLLALSAAAVTATGSSAAAAVDLYDVSE
jgi:hypothetical protein